MATVHRCTGAVCVLLESHVGHGGSCFFSLRFAENCHSFFTQVGRYKVAGLDQYTALAKEHYEEHLGLYVKAVLKKALGRMHVRSLRRL